MNNKKAMERIHKIEKNNLIQQENLRIRLEKSNNDFRERLNRVTEIKNIRRNKNVLYLDKNRTLLLKRY